MSRLEGWDIALKLNKVSLKWKVFFYILLFALIVISVFCIFQILLLERVYKSTKIKQTKVIMQEVIEVASNERLDNIKNPTSDFSQNIKEIIKDAEVDVYILKKEPINNGNSSSPIEVTYLSIYPNNDIDLFYNTVLTKDQLALTYSTITEVNNPSFVVLTDDNLPFFQQQISDDSKIIQDKDLIYCQRVKLADNSSSYMVVIYARITPVQPAIDTLKTQLLYITIIVIVLSIFIALFIAKGISKPIAQINNEAKKLAKGDYDLSFNGNGYLEISELNDTLNYAISEVKKTDILKQELIANVSHDLRTPLTLIEGYAEMLRDFPEENTSENVQIIIDEVSHLKDLVTDLLTLSKINARSEPLNLTEFSITELIESIVNRQQKLVKVQNFIINFTYKEKVNVIADKLKIEQVIYNLINNAISYSGDSKQIDIVQEIDNDFALIKVIDYGIGIKEGDLPYIWDRYYRVDKGHTRSNQGSGLGLSIIKGILDYHGFAYGVDSTYQKGSTFWFKIKIRK